MFSRKWSRLVFLVTAALLSTTCLTFAQGYGKISGIVADSSGAVIPSASVVLLKTGTGESMNVQTNSSGFYVFPALAPTNYKITVSASGFQDHVQSGITLQADQNLTINVQLNVGSQQTTVTVNTSAVNVDTTSSTLSEVIGQGRVEGLPLNGRNLAQLPSLVAGAIVAPSDSADQGQTKTFPVVIQSSINGSRGNQVNFLLDGGNNVDEYTDVNMPFPMPDAVQEFSVETSNYNAQYGLDSGGVVNIITKSGTSSYHGDLFEFVRNAVFDAPSYFDYQTINGANTKINDPLKRNQFGGTVGGPVTLHPLSSSVKKTFFFGSLQRTLMRDNVAGTTAYLPTSAEINNGDFSAYLSATSSANPIGKVQQAYNPVTKQAYAGNQINAALYDPAAVKLLSYLPISTGTIDGKAIYQKPVIQNFLEGVGRVDHDFSNNDKVMIRFFGDNFLTPAVFNPSNLLTYQDGVNIFSSNAILEETHTFSSNVINQARLAYTHELAHRGPDANAISVTDLGVTNIWQPAVKALQSVSVTNFFSIGDNPSGDFARNNYTLADDVHFVIGNHDIAFGGLGEIAKIDITSQNQEPGSFGFNTTIGGSTLTNPALVNFLLGYMGSFSQGNGQFYNNRYQYIGFYVQDAYKANHRLTLNYGLRYEPYFPQREIFHRLEQFNPAAYAAGTISQVYTNAPAGLLFPGDKGMPEWGVKSRLAGFEPRLGFAYDLYGDGKTSIRGGAGIFYDTRTIGVFDNSMSTSSPYSISETLTAPITGGFSNPYEGITNPFPTPVTPTKNVAFPLPVVAITYDPTGNFHVPITYNYNLSLEHQITSNMMIRTAYVGSHTSHLFAPNELNPAVYTSGSTLSTNQRRLYKNMSNITEADMGGNTGFNSLQFSLQASFAHRVDIHANYVWSKALDNLPYGAKVTGPSSGQPYAMPIYTTNYKALDKGPSDIDHRQRFVVSYVWTLPTPAANRMIKELTGGWQTTGIVQTQTGDPLTVLAGNDQSQTGLGRDRGQTVASQSVYGSGGCKSGAVCRNWLNPNGFAQPAVGTYGNVVKGSYVGPAYTNWDAGLLRAFNFKNIMNLTFRAEYFDVLNHAEFADPSTTVNAAGFGSITSVQTSGGYPISRIGQLALKLVF